jgi:hypothetical protein
MDWDVINDAAATEDMMMMSYPMITEWDIAAKQALVQPVGDVTYLLRFLLHLMIGDA